MTPPEIAPGVEWQWCEDHWFCRVGNLICTLRNGKLSDGTVTWDSHIGDSFDEVLATTSGPVKSPLEAVQHLQRELVRIRNSLSCVQDPDATGNHDHCFECGGEMNEQEKPGREFRYGSKTWLIPAWYKLPTCTVCHADYVPELSELALRQMVHSGRLTEVTP